MKIIYENLTMNLAGKKVAVIGRGALVGKPLVPMLIDEQATVVSCNSATPPDTLLNIIKDAELIISATGQKDLITADMLADDRTTFIIDAGITTDDNGKLCGDCDKKMYDLENTVITTVPGGVGLTTRLALMENVVNATVHRLSSVDEIPDFIG